MDSTGFIPTSEVQLGMFVSELDIPWIESPFLLQGFLVEEEDQLAELRRCSKQVRVDFTRSLGTHYRAPAAPPKKVASSDDELRVVLVPVPAAARPKDGGRKAAERTDVPSLVDILRSIVQSSGPVDAHRAGATQALPPQAIITEARSTRPRGPGSSVHMAVEKELRKRPIADRPSLWSRTVGKLLPKRSEDLGRTQDVHGDDPYPAATENSSGPATLFIYVPIEEELPRAAESFERVQAALNNVIEDLQAQRVPQVERVQEAAEQIVASVNRNPDAMLWLITLKKTDRPAYDQALNVSVHMSILGLHLALPQHEVQWLAMAGLLLDIGRTRLPDSILGKTAPLTDDELALVRRHVGWSVEIVSEIPDMPREIVEIVARHHERWDGNGYPQGISGEFIGLHSEIAGICDSYCAMRSLRPYAAPRASQDVLQELGTLRGSSFSDGLVDQLVQCVGAFPVGALVELNTGEVGIVIEQNRVRRLKPRIMLLLAPDKARYEHPAMLALINDPIAYDDVPYRITKTLPNGSYGLDPREFYL